MSSLWWRRVTSYLLRIVLSASLLSQLVGSILSEGLHQVDLLNPGSLVLL